METKTFEIRDRGTFIPILAVRLLPETERDRYLFARAGFGKLGTDQGNYVLLAQISGGGGRCASDPYEWPGGARTFPQAHQYILQNWASLPTGALIDVEFVNGEKDKPALSEQVTAT